MAPLPKPPGQRRRRNLSPSWTTLPADGSGRKAPPLPRETRAQGMVTAFLPGNRAIQAVPDWVFPLTFSEGR